MFGFNKKEKEHKDAGDIKKLNTDVIALYKEIRKEAKDRKDQVIITALSKVNLDINFGTVIMKNADGTQLDSVYKLTELIRTALIDAEELVKKGTSYGVQLALNRIEGMIADREIIKSAFLVPEYEKFEANLWNVIKLREIAYGEITALKIKQDNITKTALLEKDSMMRVRYFDDIRVLEKDILRLENEAHQYDTIQASLHSEEILKGVLQTYMTPQNEVLELNEFEDTVKKLSSKGE